MRANNANKIQGLIYPELSYKIVGSGFNVFNELGAGLSEKIYQAALAKEFAHKNIFFEREVYIPLEYQNENVGRYFADFIVDNKVIVELKVVSKLGYAHTKQLLGYLRSSRIKLGILLYFTNEGVKYRRVLNSMV